MKKRGITVPIVLLVSILSLGCGISKAEKPEKSRSMNATHTTHTNKLIDSTSPYLLQHAHNPVDWYPWGEEALQKAKEEDKPIFLSIGYSACHWCHVMAHESFEDEETAAIMNKYFINIKVDREERPDLDEIYMSAVQAMTGSGGWPMSVFLTPDLKPFYGGTYFPPTDMYGRPGFKTVLQSIAQAYKEHRKEINESADKLAGHIQDMMTLSGSGAAIEYAWIETCFQELHNRFDAREGGFGGAPKFPHSMDISLLLRYAHHSGNQTALDMSEFSLEKMARGGMYDQLGGGFHRYSTDAKWLIPHFEKMLYDNALLARTYTEAYQITQKPFYQTIVRETLDYVLREMTSPEGGFYSSQDADSEGEEGIFFVWTPQQITDLLGEKKSRIVCRYYGVEEGGNFEHGTSVLHVPNDKKAVAASLDISLDQLEQTLDEAKPILFAEREKRIKPGLDDKILTDWNGLMISSMAYAGNVLQDETYIEVAEKACSFLLSRLLKEDRLLHTYKDGRAHTNGFLSDYAFLVHGLIDTYEASQDPRWLESALHVTDMMIEKFWDSEQGAFFFTSHDHEALIARSKNPMDNAVPSGNSLAILSLLRLSEMTGNREYRQKAEQSLLVFSSGLKRMPSAYTQMLSAVDFLLSSPREIVLSGPNAKTLQPMQQALFSSFFPHQVVLYNSPDISSQLTQLTSITEGKKPVNGSPTAYVCQDFTCQQPVSTVEDLLKQLKK